MRVCVCYILTQGFCLRLPSLTMDGVRWAFRCGKWKPTREQWMLAAQCIQTEEKQRIGRFVFQKDAKSAMVRKKYVHLFVFNFSRMVN